MLTQERVRELFDYHEDGHLIWKSSISNVKQGDIAGSRNHRGYVRIRIDDKYYYAHRLIFLYHKGYMPRMIDHDNKVKSDNKIGNLRDCTRSQNHANMYKSTRNKSGYKGVTRNNNKINPWCAFIRKDGKTIYIGVFPTAEEAHDAYIAKAKELFGEFACT